MKVRIKMAGSVSLLCGVILLLGSHATAAGDGFNCGHIMPGATRALVVPMAVTTEEVEASLEGLVMGDQPGPGGSVVNDGPAAPVALPTPATNRQCTLPEPVVESSPNPSGTVNP